jgi:hypothetical protein
MRSGHATQKLTTTEHTTVSEQKYPNEQKLLKPSAKDGAKLMPDELLHITQSLGLFEQVGLLDWLASDAVDLTPLVITKTTTTNWQ